MTNLDSNYYSILPEVTQAFDSHKPVVALESTVITHGLPYPENLQLAGELEDVIRSQDCIPATIALLQGKICVGIDRGQLEQLVSLEGLVKVSVRDISSTVSAKKSGGTTVAGTLAIAQGAGIKIFATGGIGGVHRGESFDISADLMQLSRTNMVVVCAGAKAILDIPATLEVLESYGVPVIGYRTNDFPAFYSRSSGIPVNIRADSAEEVANIAKIHWDLRLPGSILLAVPPPLEIAIDREMVESAIQAALAEIEDRGIHGQTVTPYLLRRVSELTDGKSLKANLGLLRNNARIAAEIAHFLY